MMRPKLTKEELSQLTLKSNLNAFSDVLVHVALLVFTGWLFQTAWHEGMIIHKFAAWLVYSGAFCFLGHYGLAHALSHRSVFTANDTNDQLYWVVSVLTWNNAFYFRAGHQIHHHKSIEEDPQINLTKKKDSLKTNWWKLVLFDYQHFYQAVRTTLLTALDLPGKQSPPPGIALNHEEKQQAIVFTRAILGFHVIVFIYALSNQLYWLIFLINLGAFGFTLPNRILAHLHQESTKGYTPAPIVIGRTILLPRWLAFLSWNMNYQIEHHWYPSVPYNKLPELHLRVCEYTKHSTLKGITAAVHALK